MLKKVLVTVATVAFMSAIFGGCNRAKNYCERADECNVLIGSSVDECTENMESCLDDLTSSEESDWEDDIDECLEHSGCDRFVTCLYGLYCF